MMEMLRMDTRNFIFSKRSIEADQRIVHLLVRYSEPIDYESTV